MRFPWPEQSFAAPTARLKVAGTTQQPGEPLDDGQFGAARVLTAFNDEQAFNRDAGAKVNCDDGDLRACGSVAVGAQKGRTTISNQHLFDPDGSDDIRKRFVKTDRSQTITASSGDLRPALLNGAALQQKSIDAALQSV